MVAIASARNLKHKIVSKGVFITSVSIVKATMNSNILGRWCSETAVTADSGKPLSFILAWVTVALSMNATLSGAQKLLDKK